MKAIARQKGKSLFIKIFESKEFDCTIFVYLDEDNKVISMNYHWGTDYIHPKYMEFNGKGETTQLYKIFHQLNGANHSAKLYDQVIGAHSITHKKDLKIAELETELAEEKLKSKKLKTDLKKVKKLAKLAVA